MKSKVKKSNQEMVWSYFSAKKKKLVGWPYIYDSTESYVLSQKTKKPILKNIVCCSKNNLLLWKGWFTRMDRVGNIMFRAKQSAENFSKNIVYPEVQRIYAMRPKGKVVLTLQVPSNQGYYTIHKNNSFYDDSKELTYSSGYNDSLLFNPTMCQNSDWETEYFDWENNFQLGENFSKIAENSNSKWSRFHKAKGIFTYILSAKLEDVQEKYAIGDIIELNIAGIPYRFEKIDRKYTQNRDNPNYLSWKELSIKPIVSADLSGIIPKWL